MMDEREADPINQTMLSRAMAKLWSELHPAAATLPGMTVEALRNLIDQFDALGPEDNESVGRRDVSPTLSGPPVPVRLYTPMALLDTTPVIVFAHGGGFVAGSLQSHDRVCKALAHFSQSIVCAVDYRLAPEHPFPAAREDLINTIEWVRGDAGAPLLGVRPIILAGDSAGGCLAVLAANALSDDKGVDGLLLFYPALDASLKLASVSPHATGSFLTAEVMASFWASFIGFLEPERSDHCPSAITETARLPSTMLVVASHDPLTPEGFAFAHRLASAGVAIELAYFPGVMHGFVSMSARLPEGLAALRAAADWVLRHNFGR